MDVIFEKLKSHDLSKIYEKLMKKDFENFHIQTFLVYQYIFCIAFVKYLVYGITDCLLKSLIVTHNYTVMYLQDQTRCSLRV